MTHIKTATDALGDGGGDAREPGGEPHAPSDGRPSAWTLRCWRPACARISSAGSSPLLEQMAPGQAELKYVDVRVTRPTSLPSGASPGFEEMAPGTEFVAEKAEVQLVIDAKLRRPSAATSRP